MVVLATAKFRDENLMTSEILLVAVEPYEQIPWFRRPSEHMPTPKLSTDWWAVLVALVTAALVRFGLMPHIPW